jgi:hypothetical protein
LEENEMTQCIVNIEGKKELILELEKMLLDKYGKKLVIEFDYHD